MTTTWQQWQKRLAGFAPARMAVALPRTGRFAGTTLWRHVHADPDGPPAARLSPALLASVTLDEAALLAAMGPNRFPRRADYEQSEAELTEALELFEERGWLADPASYHDRPPPLDRPQITTGWAQGLRYERLWWDSGYRPHPGEPGGDRWEDYATNRTASAWVLRHPDGPRPWVMCVHGFGMGYPFMELFTFGVAHLHRDLGLNVVGPTLPLHGPRKVTRLSGEAFLGFDLMNSVHGLAQSVWDLRRLLSWVRQQEPTRLGVHGISLGAYVASLLVGHEPGLDVVVAGVPVTDFPTLLHHHAPTHIRLRSLERGIMGGAAQTLHRVVSPLVLAPLVPYEGRFIYAGTGDRLSPPRQAYDLWRAWSEPRIEWFEGSHIGFLWSGAVHRFVDRSLRAAGLVPDGEPRVPAA